MRTRAYLSSLPALGLGLALGAAATCVALRPSAPGAPALDARPPAPFEIPAWAWRETPAPPRLTRDRAADAIAAWHSLRAPDGGPPAFATRVGTLRALLLRLPADSFPRLLDPLSRTDDADTKALRRIAFVAWTTQAAPAAAAWAAPRDESFAELARLAIEAWAARDPIAAATWASGLPDPALARRLAPRALGVLASTQPERALALARSRDPGFRDAALESIIAALSPKDPAGTLRAFAPELWRNGEGFHRLRTPLAAWARQDPAAAIAWIVAQPREPDSPNLSHWLSSLGDNSPGWRRTIADTIATTPGLAGRANALRDLVFNWANQNPDEAVAWLKQLPDPDLRITVLERLSGSYYNDKPEKSLPLALAMPDGFKRDEALSRLLGAWAEVNSDAALAWLRQNQSEPGVVAASRAVHAKLLAELAREDPRAAIAEYAAIADGSARAAAIGPIAQSWGRVDPGAAFRWAAEQSAATPRHSFGDQHELLARWAKTEPDAALRWVEDWHARATEGSRYLGDYYLEALAGTWSEKFPRAATADLYARIKDPVLRAKALHNHVRDWLANDPAAARAWLESSSAISPGQRTALLAVTPR